MFCLTALTVLVEHAGVNNPGNESVSLLPVCMRTVQKDGANQGRQFYTCSKPREDQCGFFEWADDVPPSNVRLGTGRGRGRGGGGSSEVAGGEGKRKRAPPRELAHKLNEL